MATQPQPTGARVLIDELVAQGVEVVFGHPGGAILPIYDALHGSPLRHVLCRHEQGAAHAADGYARASGRVGVCFATSGPGATNLITGLATAHLDSVAVLAVTGQVATTLIGTDAFQEADIIGATLPLVKHSYQVRAAADIRRVVREALHIAATGRPGPVLIDMPKDVQLELVPPEPAVPNAHLGEASAPLAPGVPGGRAGEPPTGSASRTPAGGGVRVRGYRLPAAPDPAAVARAAALCRTASRPLLVVGGGAAKAGAEAEVAQLQSRLGCPVVATLMGIGTFPGDHPAYLGMLGMHGAPGANHATAQADLLIAAGIRFDDRVTGDPRRFAPGARVIHIDVDAAEIGKIKRADVGIAADCRAALADLVAALGPGEGGASGDADASGAGGADGASAAAGAGGAAVAGTARLWRPELPADHQPAPGGPGPYPEERFRDGRLSGPAAVRAMRAASPADVTIVADVGQHQMWCAQHFTVHAPRRFITSGGLGTMGYALPAAIGARFARPDQPVLCVTGDGGLQMTVQELATIGALQLPIVVAVLNNGHLGMVRQWQELFFDQRYSASELWNPDFCRLAEAYAIPAVRVSGAEELARAVRDAFAAGRPLLLDVRVAAEENTWPIVPAGAAVDEMMVPEAGGER